MELVKERFSKLLLGEDMSGGGKGVCTAVAISNAITNLYGTHARERSQIKLRTIRVLASSSVSTNMPFDCFVSATVFGSCHKLEPLPAGKKAMWRREMDCLLSVCDYIVEFYPTTQTLPDGTKVEVPHCCPCLSTGPFVPSCEIQFSSKKLGVSLFASHLDVSDQSRSIRAGHGDQTKIGHLHQPARAREARRHAHCKIRSQLLLH